MTFKLGKLPARPDAVKFKLTDYLNASALPKPPTRFGHEVITLPWQMLGNDNYGDCVFAGAAHETMLWNHEAGRDTRFTDASVLSDYSAVTGFNPHDPNSDQGTDMAVAASYRRKTGVVDAAGQRHTVAAYLAIQPGNITQMFQAMYLFGAVGIGIEFPGSAMTQFNQGRPWKVVAGATIEGGHYVPLVARRHYIEVVTWGRIQPVTQGFLEKYVDEVLAYVSTEALMNNKSPEGFDAATLLQDLSLLH